MKGRITAVQRMSIHDGPGIRTTVFLKGCNMRCPWCHNPETWSHAFELQLLPDKCIRCHHCVASCAHHAWSLPEAAPGDAPENSPPALPRLARELCRLQGDCLTACHAGAITLVGEDTTVERLMSTIVADEGYYRQSGGGVTISGGEPLLQAAFAEGLLRACRARSLSTAIETNLSVAWEVIEPLLPWVDLWMCDLKLADSDRHRQWTGVDNRNILANLQHLADRSVPVIVRTPVIPGVNDSAGDITAIGNLLRGWTNVVRYELLPFHPLGAAKFASLGLPNRFPAEAALDRERWAQLTRIPSALGLPTRPAAERETFLTNP